MKMCSCTILTLGAVAAGAAAIGMAGMAMTQQGSQRRCHHGRHGHHGHRGHHGMRLCGCSIDPVKDMRRMADNVHGMVSDVVSHQCGHLG